MFMHRSVSAREDWEEIPVPPLVPSLQVDPFTPLSERIALRQPELTEGLEALKQSLESADFDRYIESLVAARLEADSLWLITDREMQRSLLERNFLPQIRKAFGVSRVRVISQA